MVSKGRRINHKKISQIMLCTSHATHHLFFPLQVLGLAFSLLYICCCSATDTIMFNNSISDERGETLVSAKGTFELGFFAPNESLSKARYVGIWYYNFTQQTVVWVANRDSPLSDRSGSFGVKEDGNLKVLDGKGNVKWFTNFESATSSNMTAKLEDSGNLILIDQKSGKTSWESFKNPTDTFLPGMKMTESLRLTSWNSINNPATGNFTFQQDPNDDKQYNVVKNGSIQHWKSGVSGKFIITDDLTSAMTKFLSGFTSHQLTFTTKIIRNKPITVVGSYVDTRLVIDSSGQVRYYLKDKITRYWLLIWAEPRDLCGVFNACGYNGICNSTKGLTCKCLPGFQPVWPNNWNSSDFSGGCKRKTPLCGGIDEKIDHFVNLTMMKVGMPELQLDAKDEKNCKDECVRKCDCGAYSYEKAQKPSRSVDGDGGGSAHAKCWTWYADLNNLRKEYPDGRDLNVRIALSDIVSEGSPEPPVKPLKQPSSYKFSRSLIIGIAISSVVVVIALLCAIVYIPYLWKRRLVQRQENMDSIQRNQALYGSERHVRNLIDSSDFKEEDKKGIDVPFFDLESIVAATDNFSDANKLGQGGFGSVYKGTLLGGREIAIKRLSSVSLQGLGEFKNEVVLIAKLQHRNLVRLLGYCIKGEEKILLYEYMPNKSLDSFIFDRTHCTVLNWELRFNIILGIARGLLYLHQDSRLRIIHRDLKTSNILLDEEMNPKISDFGLARIFEGKQIEGTTNRVVGTYGYMAPEYALDGLFSIKSDVFSFGVVVLEIISGRRNTGFYQSKIPLSLLGYAWKSWNEDQALDMMHETLRETCNTNEFLRCLNVGLLCVQEDVNDRPTMSNVVFMLGNETTTLPTPKQPAFTVRRDPSTIASSSTKPETMTNSAIVEGR